MEINNKIYDDIDHGWWDEDGNGNLVSLRYLTNPVKFNYINNIIKNQKRNQKKSFLNVGCGGGYPADKLDRAGFEVIGLDPSNNSIKAAKVHAKQENLTIKFVEGFGEKLPFKSNSFHFVCCYKSKGSTFLDFMGPWPWYIFSMAAAGVIFYSILFAPYFIKDVINRRKGQTNSFDQKPKQL